MSWELTIESSQVLSNVITYPSGNGGGIHSSGPMTLTDSLIGGNRGSAASYGGGMYSTGSLALIRSTVIENQSRRAGGGQGRPIVALRLFQLALKRRLPAREQPAKLGVLLVERHGLGQ